PNGDQPIWAFAEANPTSPSNVAIGYGGSMPSRVELPVVPGVGTTTGLPPCPGLRGEPCRDYQAFTNEPAPPTLPAAGGGNGGQQPGGSSTSKKKCKKRKHRKHKRAAEAKKKHKRSCKKRKRHKHR